MRRRIWIPLLCLSAWHGMSLAQDERGRDTKPKENRDEEIEPRKEDLPRMPGAVFLYGVAPDGVWLSTSRGIIKVQPLPEESRAWEGPGLDPSITRDGSIVASGLWKSYRPRRVAIATYSVVDRRWTEYVEGDFQAGVAISPDGAKLAYLGESEKAQGDCYIFRVHVIDRKTLRETIAPMRSCGPPKTASWPDGPPEVWPMGMSFSPSGNRLVYGSYPIRLWDLDSNTEKEVADGAKPAWSPDGEWIAYLNSAKDLRHSMVGMVHPDGSSAKILWTLPRSQAFFGRPVWAPDSKSLLLNWAREKEGKLNIRQLDLETLKFKTVFKDVWAVGGWAEESQKN